MEAESIFQHIASEPTVNSDTALLRAVRTWGWLVVIASTSTVGLFSLAWTDSIARQGNSLAATGFWVGLLLIFVPALIRLFSLDPSRSERLGIVVIVGLSLYLLKVLHSPAGFTFHDEFLHWRTATDILQTQHLFVNNSLLPVSPLYPALEIVTTALSRLTGLSIYESGIVLLGVGRLLLVLALFLVFEQVSGSTRIAALALMIYAANANFIFFDAQFSYESLALPLAALALCAAAQAIKADQNIAGFMLMGLLGIAALTITHHLTAYLLALFLAVWMIITLIREPQRKSWALLAILATTALVFSILWTQHIASATASYLTPVFASGFAELISLIKGEASGRALFTSATGLVAPLWERIVGILSALLILAGLPIGLRAVWRWFRQRPLAVALALLVFGYPVSLLMRFTSSGWEIASRTSEFIFMGIAFVLAMGIITFEPDQLSARVRGPLFATSLVIIFVGGVISGWTFWARTPGPYLVSADTRSIEPEGISAATWAHDALPHDQPMAADRINRLLMATYGQQLLVTHLYNNVDVATLYFAPRVGQNERQIIQDASLRYLLVDYRLTQGLPELGIYFEAGEPNTGRYTSPISASALDKFDTLPHAARIFDSGDIVIYDLKKLPPLPMEF